MHEHEHEHELGNSTVMCHPQLLALAGLSQRTRENGQGQNGHPTPLFPYMEAKKSDPL